MVGAIGPADGWTASTSARACGIAVALVAHALVVAAWLLEPSASRPAFGARPIGVRLVDEARALPDAPTLPPPVMRRTPLPLVPIPDVQVSHAGPAPAIIAQPVVPQAIVAIDAAPAVPRHVAPPAVPTGAPIAAPAMLPWPQAMALDNHWMRVA
jgi:hypothetical protein